MNEGKELCIRILPDAGKIMIETHEDGITSCKEIQEDAFLDCIKGSIRHEAVSGGFLPPNCLFVRIHPDGGKDYGLWYPELYADIRYHETAYPHFPLPRLVFAFHAEPDGKIRTCRMGVVADERLTPETKMYIYPFSNVSGKYGNLCIGANALPQYKKPHALANLPTLLLSIPNGDHSYSPRNNKLGLQYRDLLEHLKGKDPSYYYSDILIENGLTLMEFLKGGKL